MSTQEQMRELHRDLLVYGFILTDNSFTTLDGEHRVRTFRMFERIFYDYMHNGIVIDCKELK